MSAPGIFYHFKNNISMSQKSTTRRKPFFRSAAIAGIVLCSLFSRQNAAAQWTDERSFLFSSNNVKHYTLAPLDGADFYLMAGTVYAWGGVPYDQAVHWMFIDNAGNTIQTKAYNDPDYAEYVAGAGFVDANDAFIVASRVSNNNPGNMDDIEILRIDGAGNLQATSRIVNSTDPTYTNLYPMGTLLYNQTELFICGYATPNLPGVRSSLATDKQAFVLKYDLVTNTVINIHFMDGGGPVAGVDLDMATRMKSLQPGIWVGGSVNDGYMMNRIIDPVTLNDIYSVSLGTPSLFNPPPASQTFESSYDIAEDPAGNNWYVFGNSCRVSDAGTTPMSYMTPYGFHITATDAALTPLTGLNRARYNSGDATWGINTVKVNGSELVLSGMQATRQCNSPAPENTSPDNINPFLTSIRTGVSGQDIVLNTYFWNTVLSAEGTGPNTMSIAYQNLGRPEANQTVGPVTTVNEKGSTTDIMLTCPVWNTRDGQLGIKWIRTDMNGEMATCKWAPACNVSYAYSNVPAGSLQNNTAASAVPDPVNYTDMFFRADAELDCSRYYRQSGVATVNHKPVTCALSPNPAGDYVQLVLAGATESRQLDVQLTDATGRNLGMLYSGKSDAVPAKLALPQLAPGIYFVHVQYSSEQLKTLSLSIK